jgi:hypothetical protein
MMTFGVNTCGDIYNSTAANDGVSSRIKKDLSFQSMYIKRDKQIIDKPDPTA